MRHPCITRTKLFLFMTLDKQCFCSPFYFDSCSFNVVFFYYNIPVIRNKTKASCSISQQIEYMQVQHPGSKGLFSKCPEDEITCVHGLINFTPCCCGFIVNYQELGKKKSPNTQGIGPATLLNVKKFLIALLFTRYFFTLFNNIILIKVED